jgi:hypothetical protein
MSQTTQVRRLSAAQQLALCGRDILAAVTAAIQAHRAPLAILVAYSASCVFYTRLLHLERYSSFSLYGVTGVHLLLLTLVCFFIMYCVRTQLRERPRQLLPHVLARLNRDFLSWDRFFSGALAIACFYLLLAVFSNYKRMIPLAIPFHLDPFFHELDRGLHFGVDPWRLLQPVMGHPLVTFITNFLYNIWLFILIMVFYWQAFATDRPALRMQYIVSFMLCWVVVGTVAATLLSSAGPCYYGDVVAGRDVYAPLMDYLYKANESYPIWALDMQQTLLENYRNRHVTLVSGITAMPSMHVSIAWLMFLLGRRISPAVARLFGAYCLCIVLGSVHLGWHYAVDGYVSIVLTTVIWAVAGRVLARCGLKDAPGAGEPPAAA